MKFDLEKFEGKFNEMRLLSIDQLVKSGKWSECFANCGYHIKETATFRYLEKHLLTNSTVLIRKMFEAAVIQAFTINEKPSVLICGESGTGKETFARSFAEPGLPFVGINCTALPEYLLESELFGHVQGAFTGAIKDREGLFHTAGNGVLFLDEIGDMPITLQPKLLRVLQERKYRSIGSNAEREVKCRVVCATHQEEKAFRKDLYDRLSQYKIEIPPLRHRVDDAWLYLKTKYPDIKFVPSDVEHVTNKGNYRDLDNLARYWQLQHWCGIVNK